MDELGKLKRTLKKKCVFCETHLQLRVRKENILVKGEVVESDYEYEYCTKCDVEVEVKSKVSRKRKYAEVPIIEEPEVKKWDKNKKNGIHDSRVDKGKSGYSKKG